jgi:hypothetical protein
MATLSTQTPTPTLAAFGEQHHQQQSAYEKRGLSSIAYRNPTKNLQACPAPKICLSAGTEIEREYYVFPLRSFTQPLESLAVYQK